MKNLAAKGFTIIELMTVLTVAAVVLGIAVPSFLSSIRNSRMTSTANEMLAAIHAARGEAIKRQARTVFCFSASPDSAPACDGTGAEGWIVFVDADNDVAVDSTEEVLLRHPALHESITVHSSQPPGNKGYISFQGSGFARGVTAYGTPVTSLVFCDDRGSAAISGDNSAARAMELTDFGRPSITKSKTTIDSLGGCT